MKTTVPSSIMSVPCTQCGLFLDSEYDGFATCSPCEKSSVASAKRDFAVETSPVARQVISARGVRYAGYRVA